MANIYIYMHMIASLRDAAGELGLGVWGLISAAWGFGVSSLSIPLPFPPSFLGVWGGLISAVPPLSLSLPLPLSFSLFLPVSLSLSLSLSPSIPYSLWP